MFLPAVIHTCWASPVRRTCTETNFSLSGCWVTPQCPTFSFFHLRFILHHSKWLSFIIHVCPQHQHLIFSILSLTLPLQQSADLWTLGDRPLSPWVTCPSSLSSLLAQVCHVKWAAMLGLTSACPFVVSSSCQISKLLFVIWQQRSTLTVSSHTLQLHEGLEGSGSVPPNSNRKAQKIPHIFPLFSSVIQSEIRVRDRL